MNKKDHNKNIINDSTHLFYSDKGLFDNIINSCFLNAWHALGPVDKFIKKGFSPASILKCDNAMPIIVSSHNDTKGLQVLSNSCTHRGHIVTETCTRQKTLRCPYHGRKFDYNGEAISAPGFKKNDDFPKENDHLFKLQTYIFSGILFASISDNDYKFFKTINNLASWFPFDRLSFNKALSKSYTIPCHWTLYVENYLEGLHVPFIHHGLSSEIDLASYKTEVSENTIIQYAKSSNSKTYLRSIDKAPKNLHEYYGMYIYMFPNLMINIYNWGISYNHIIPVSTNSTIVEYMVFSFDKNMSPTGDDAIDRVEMEDQEAISSVQRGVRSPIFRHGDLSASDEVGVSEFRKILRNAIK